MQESFKSVMISSPDYPTEIIDLTNSDSEVKIVSSDSSRRTSKEKIKTTSKSITWFLASTATVCFLPLILELERVQTEEQEAAQQRTMMLGPRAAGGGSGLAGFSAAVPHLTHIESK
ncbi:Mitochondrial import receptor subunit TOM22 like [Schistosoma japonicum]|nr:Mitochondrial import receptor subunit TOM22 like [Schistosoma japonicum]